LINNADLLHIVAGLFLYRKEAGLCMNRII
jgi:hypothetical protein